MLPYSLYCEHIKEQSQIHKFDRFIDSSASRTNAYFCFLYYMAVEAGAAADYQWWSGRHYLKRGLLGDSSLAVDFGVLWDCTACQAHH